MTVYTTTNLIYHLKRWYQWINNMHNIRAKVFIRKGKSLMDSFTVPTPNRPIPRCISTRVPTHYQLMSFVARLVLIRFIPSSYNFLNITLLLLEKINRWISYRRKFYWFGTAFAMNKREKRGVQLFSRSFKFLENKASNYVGRSHLISGRQSIRRETRICLL